MESIIKELWHGNVVPEDDCRVRSPEMKQLMEYMARHHSDLLNKLEQFDKPLSKRD